MDGRQGTKMRMIHTRLSLFGCRRRSPIVNGRSPTAAHNKERMKKTRVNNTRPNEMRDESLKRENVGE